MLVGDLFRSFGEYICIKPCTLLQKQKNKQATDLHRGWFLSVTQLQVVEYCCSSYYVFVKHCIPLTEALQTL